MVCERLYHARGPAPFFSIYSAYPGIPEGRCRDRGQAFYRPTALLNSPNVRCGPKADVPISMRYPFRASSRNFQSTDPIAIFHRDPVDPKALPSRACVLTLRMMISDCPFETAAGMRGRVKARFADCVDITLASPATTSCSPPAPLVTPHRIIAARVKPGRTKKNGLITATVLMLGFETRDGNVCRVAG
jgi:hypothetical protein